MGWILVRRLARLPLLFLAVTSASFAMLARIPGDVCIVQLGFVAGVPEKMAECRARFGLDNSLVDQYLKWLVRFVTGDFGTDPTSGRPITQLVAERASTTLELALATLVVSVLMATVAGVVMGYRPGSRTDRLLSGACYVGIVTPTFVLGTVLAQVVAVRWGWLPPIGLPPFSDGPVEHLRHLVLPVAVLVVGVAGPMARLVRTDIIATLQEDFVTMAKSKGLPHRRILVRHVLRPSSFTLVTVAGLQLGQLLGGALVVESLFNLRGYGGLLIQAVTARQSALLMTLVALVVAAFVVLNGLVDATYALLDPRIRRR